MASKETSSYNPAHIEEKWQTIWQEKGYFKRDYKKDFPKRYVLEMFPYPSGDIHMGHVRNYSMGDVIARFSRMRGFNVMYPIGWDAFGLPAENAAIKRGVHPAEWTKANIAAMRTQLKRLGFSYDWERELATCDPVYYKWNQLFFIQLFERGLAYRDRSFVNWCSGCVTVLANEQVIAGRCWRCDTEVALKEFDQWFLKITAYAEQLLQDLDTLTAWPENVRVMQQNWIGKSEGALVFFPVAGSDETIPVFTTRPDTLWGATFICLAPGHPLVSSLTKGKKEEAAVQAAVARMKNRRLQKKEALEEKEGVFTGAKAINPLTQEEIPVFIANFVLMEYGEGAIMSVPAHDSRDFEFAKKYRLPLRQVILPFGENQKTKTLAHAFEEPGILIDCGPFSGKRSEEAIPAIVDYLEKKSIGKRKISYRLRDWGISRQRYWGTPIPFVHCEDCGVVAVDAKDLPVILPTEIKITGQGMPLLDVTAFAQTTCPRCKKKARRETDTMDTFMDSSWYFLRYLSPKREDVPFVREEAKQWLPVDIYIGGIEHAILHLLYARFLTKVLRDLGWVNLDEPFRELLTQGMVLKEGAVMSKSRGNVVPPDTIVNRYGADAARLFILFAAPPEKELEWTDSGIEGAFRFLTRVWRFVEENEWLQTVSAFEGNEALDASISKLRGLIHRTVARVTRQMETKHFNTAISSIMELLTALRDACERDLNEMGRKVVREGVEVLLLLLHPFAPHMTEELYQRMGGRESLVWKPWPVWEAEVAELKTIVIPVQVNGKLRATLEVESDTEAGRLKGLALEDENVKKHVGDKKIQKIVLVPGKLINIVC